MAISCVYTDLDGTLLGKGASLFRTAEGEFTLLAARALEACHRAGAEVVIKSGRRRAQVMEDARLIGQTSYIFEVGSGMVIDGELTFLTGELQPLEGKTIHAQIEETGAPALLLERYAGRLEPHSPWHVDREVSHLFRGLIDAGEANELLGAEGHADLRLVDNGEIEDGAARLPPDPGGLVEGRRGRRAHARARIRARASASAWATRARTSTWPRSWAASSSWRTRTSATAASRRGAHRGGDERGLLRGRRAGDCRVAITRNRRYNRVYQLPGPRSQHRDGASRRTGEAARALQSGRPSLRVRP